MQNSTNTARIYGDEIFFNFIEVPFNELEQRGDLVGQIKNRELDGFITKKYSAAGRLHHTLNHIQNRAFPGAVGAQDGHDFRLPDIETDAMQRRNDTERRAYFINFKHIPSTLYPGTLRSHHHY